MSGWRALTGEVADRLGHHFRATAVAVAVEHADQAERALAEDVEDAERWQRYLVTGTVVPVESVRGRLLELADTAVEAKPR